MRNKKQLELKKLFDNWRNSSPNSTFCCDGYLSIIKSSKEKNMVLFVGAESNTKNNNKVACSQEKSCVSCEKEKEFFFYYAGLPGIKLSDSSAKRTFTKYTNRMREISNLLNCPNIAYMNLNKTGGGSSTTPKALLSSLKGNTSDYIKEQLEIIHPDEVVVFGKNAEYVWKHIFPDYNKVRFVKHFCVAPRFTSI